MVAVGERHVAPGTPAKLYGYRLAAVVMYRLQWDWWLIQFADRLGALDRSAQQSLHRRRVGHPGIPALETGDHRVEPREEPPGGVVRRRGWRGVR